MSKRRNRAGVPEEPESLTPEERRARRRRDRAHRKAGSEGLAKNPWRRAAIIGIPVAVIAVVVLVLVEANLPTPCITFQPIPTQSGVPAFPDHNTTDFSHTWCPSAQQVYGIAPKLSIVIEGSSVTLPSAIGRNSSYPQSYQCNLPLVTEPPSPPAYPAGAFSILSDWNYRYNLSTFFAVWSESYKNVAVGSSPSQPIVYQQNDLLGYTPTANQTLTLFVDNRPSSAGPLLDLTGLDYVANPYPSCLGTLYGTGHTILLSLVNKTSASSTSLRGVAPLDRTVPADPLAASLVFDGPLPHFGFSTSTVQTLAKVQHISLAWLAFRGVAG